MTTQNILKISERYSGLAESACCLSCGGAVNHAKALPGEFCVDLGSGRGTDVLRMAESVGAEGFVVGIDIAEGMIEKARATAKKLGVANVRFEKAELEDLPLETNQADLIISNCVLNHASDKGKVWKEIFRSLKPGGRFVISDIYSLQAVPAEFKNDSAAIAECWAGSDTREQYLATILHAGFPEIDIIEESKPYSKGKVEVCSWTIAGVKPSTQKYCCC
jgi:ubiquinone/menaquinone biosynthesis C-methylase UbiE